MNTDMFGERHILVLAICAVYIVAGLILLAKFKLPMKKLNRLMLYVGIVSETIKIVFYILANEDNARGNGYLPKTDLPFHLCSIQLIFILILNLSDSEKIKRLLYSFMYPTCLIGGFAAMMIPTSSARTAWVITFQYFIYHSSIMIFAIYLILTKEFRFKISDYANALKLLLVMFFTAIYLNSWVNDYDIEHQVNFMYVVNPPVEGLPFLTREYGWLVYIVHYAFLCVFAVTVCYLRPIIRSFSHNDKIKSDPAEAGPLY